MVEFEVLGNLVFSPVLNPGRFAQLLSALL